MLRILCGGAICMIASIMLVFDASARQEVILVDLEGGNEALYVFDAPVIYTSHPDNPLEYTLQERLEIRFRDYTPGEFITIVLRSSSGDVFLDRTAFASHLITVGDDAEFDIVVGPGGTIVRPESAAGSPVTAPFTIEICVSRLQRSAEPIDRSGR